jgi:transcriptional regulator GlxA family with amidase domain
VGVAPRSLQRTLGRAGLSLSAISAEVRLRHAAGWLLESALPIAEVGFVYADQAHLSREFKRRTSPGAYRQGFATSRAAA